MKRVVEYRIGICGLTGSGKTSIIKKICYDILANDPPTTEEYQDTATWDNYFVYFWDFPPSILTSSTADDKIIGFGGIIYVLDVNRPDLYEESRLYLEDIMKSSEISNLPLLIICSKVDLVEDPILIKPSTLMNDLTINMKKAQCIMFSAKTGEGTEEIQQWILKSANVVDNKQFFDAQSQIASRISSTIV